MRWLGLDPGSRRTGYAVMDGPQVIVDAGYLRPQHRDDAAVYRVFTLCDELERLIQEHKPGRAVIEVCSGKVGGGQRRGAASALAIYGMAVGGLAMVMRKGVSQVLFPDERSWTGCVPKATRSRRIAAMFPQYRQAMGRDAGGDVGDAIGLALWGMVQP